MKKEIYIFATDTVYGIGCTLNDLESIKKIKELKNRDVKKPLAILCANVEQVKTLVKDFSSLNKYTKYWPGALTIIFEKNENVSDTITGNLNTVGIRIPNSKELLKFIETTGPLVTTSLNVSGNEPVVKSEQLEGFKGWGKLLEFEEPKEKISSTVINSNGEILRQGSIKIK